MTIPASTPTGFQPADAERVQNQADLNAVLALLSGQPSSGAGTATQVLHGAAAGFAAVSLTADVTGTLPIANGGTNGTTAAVNGAVVYSTATAYAMTAAGTSGQLLQSAGAASPVWAGDTAWTAPTLAGTWTNVGGATATTAYIKDASGFVHLRGKLNCGGVGTTIFTLPAGYRPSATQDFSIEGNTVYTQLGITAGGAVIYTVGNNTVCSLSGVTFDTR